MAFRVAFVEITLNTPEGWTDAEATQWQRQHAERLAETIREEINSNRDKITAGHIAVSILE